MVSGREPRIRKVLWKVSIKLSSFFLVPLFPPTTTRLCPLLFVPSFMSLRYDTLRAYLTDRVFLTLK